MTDWRDNLTPEEAGRLIEIADAKRQLSREARRIFDRARKREQRGVEKTLGKTSQ